MNMNGKVALVTGATNGIGKVTALELAKVGYRVAFTSRDRAKGERTLEEIRTASGNDALELYVGDLSSMAEVRRIALEVRAKHPKLDLLVNNAGGVFMEPQNTVDGFEYTFAFNHLSYFLITNLLLESLKAADHARVVSVSSSANYGGKIKWDDLEFSSRYSGFASYAQSKLMNILFANELARRLKGSGVTSNSLHPGLVSTGFGQNVKGILKEIVSFAVKRVGLTPEKGAETTLYLATSSEVSGVTGQFFDTKKQKRANSIAYDEAAQKRLWDLSEKLVAQWLDPVQSARAEAKV
jgi:NAD(P)-dependent dehydrogenase (short-subunit alcohol dehydrogenase family)